ncbi:MAG TPA: DUF4395 domain-containing protein [Sunxiuqinia sp.]|nr:DUF4395 domain-containing protein [Sunxiuqinia sp.]
MKNIFCPISDERINEQVARTTALLVVITAILAFGFNSIILMAFLVADFYVRAFTKMKFSPLSYASNQLNQLLKLPVKPIDKAPKIFAARMGFTMSFIFTVLHAVQLTTASAIVAGIMVLFAGLEFAIAFCAGCTIYTYMVLPFYKQ